jgi:hypothetical protein
VRPVRFRKPLLYPPELRGLALPFNNLANWALLIPPKTLPFLCRSFAVESLSDRARQIRRVDDVVPVKHIASLPSAQFHNITLWIRDIEIERRIMLELLHAADDSHLAEAVNVSRSSTDVSELRTLAELAEREILHPVRSAINLHGPVSPNEN